MLSVSALARRCGVSRTAVLYYESIRLLKPARRTASNYRVYGDRELQRWHAEFERSAPAEHQEFLEFLHIAADEVRAIRDWSRAQLKA